MTRVSHPLTASPRARAAGFTLFAAIVVSALTLAVIISLKVSEFGWIANPSLFFATTLLITCLVAVPIACFAWQFEVESEDLKESVPTDPLTGLMNARHLELSMTEASGWLARDHPSCCVAMFEIDHLDRITDIHGQAFADDIIRWVAQTVHGKMRSPFDKLSRVRDGQFIVVLSDITLEQAEGVCERLLRQIKAAATDIEAEGNKLTLSFGVALLSDETTFVAARNEAADALFDAQRFGRNQVRTRSSTVIFGAD